MDTVRKSEYSIINSINNKFHNKLLDLLGCENVFEATNIVCLEVNPDELKKLPPKLRSDFKIVLSQHDWIWRFDQNMIQMTMMTPSVTEHTAIETTSSIKSTIQTEQLSAQQSLISFVPPETTNSLPSMATTATTSNSNIVSKSGGSATYVMQLKPAEHSSLTLSQSITAIAPILTQQLESSSRSEQPTAGPSLTEQITSEFPSTTPIPTLTRSEIPLESSVSTVHFTPKRVNKKRPFNEINRRDDFPNNQKNMTIKIDCKEITSGNNFGADTINQIFNVKRSRVEKQTIVEQLINKFISTRLFWWAFFLAIYKYNKKQLQPDIKGKLCVLWNNIIVRSEQKIKSNLELKNIFTKYMNDNNLYNYQFYNELVRSNRDSKEFVGFFCEQKRGNEFENGLERGRVFEELNIHMPFELSTSLVSIFTQDVKLMCSKRVALILYILWFSSQKNTITSAILYMEVLHRTKQCDFINGEYFIEKTAEEIIRAIDYDYYDDGKYTSQFKTLSLICNEFKNLISDFAA